MIYTYNLIFANNYDLTAKSRDSYMKREQSILIKEASLFIPAYTNLLHAVFIPISSSFCTRSRSLSFSGGFSERILVFRYPHRPPASLVRDQLGRLQREATRGDVPINRWKTFPGIGSRLKKKKNLSQTFECPQCWFKNEIPSFVQR